MDQWDQVEQEYLETREARRAAVARSQQQQQPFRRAAIQRRPVMQPVAAAAGLPVPVHATPMPTAESMMVHRQPAVQPQMVVGGLPIYDVSLAQTPEQQSEPLLTRRIAGIPAWGWGIIGVGTLAGGWYLYSHGLKPNKEEAEPEPEREPEPPPSPALPEKREWEPSRTVFGDQLRRWMSKRALPVKDVTVYVDSDVAMKHCKPCSPLVTIKCASTVQMPLDELNKFAAREGLAATDHGSGIIGFYPADSGSKKAQLWEEYVDLLRDDGQEI